MFSAAVAWTWYVLIGTVVCFSVGYAVSLLRGAAEPDVAVAQMGE